MTKWQEKAIYIWAFYTLQNKLHNDWKLEFNLITGKRDIRRLILIVKRLKELGYQPRILWGQVQAMINIYQRNLSFTEETIEREYASIFRSYVR